MPNQNNNTRKVRLCVGIFFCFIATMFVFLLCGKKENYSSTSNENITVSALDCIYSKVPSGAFFELSGENSPTHEIKAIFSDDKISKLDYTYKAIFNTNELATAALSDAHGKYNIYMYKTSIDQEGLLPTFSTIKNQNIINLFFENSTFTKETATFLFLDSDSFEEFRNFTLDQVKKFYENKGMVCQLINEKRR